MLFTNRGPSSEEMQKALFDYLNLNRHKFDEDGNFVSRPDERDYVPLVLAKSPPPPYTWAPGGPQSPKKPQKWWHELNDPKKWNKQNEEIHARRRQDWDAGVEYDGDECLEHYNDALSRCARRWLRTDIRIPEDAPRGCKARATELWAMCNQHNGYPRELLEWGWEDNGIDDVEDYLNGGPAPNEVRPDSSEPEPDPESARSELYGWAKSQLERFAPPPLESSMEDDPIFRQQPLMPVVPWRRLQRGIRVAPGMGFGGGGGGGGGKPGLFPRYPGDPLGPRKLFWQ